ncbi:MAG: hypothetical protein M1819_006236 [Sarea resinae]|nr:MAG: hypothetical protein M1819_006236 [Sarea resinae]
MIIFKDIITDDEVISDSYPMKEVDGIVYEIECKMITKGGENFDIGANPSAEGGEDEDVDEAKQQVIDVVDAFRLEKADFIADKKAYLTQLKTYMKKVKEAMKKKGADDATVSAFEKGAAGYAKKIISNFKDYDTYLGPSMDPDGMLLLLNYREDGVTPFFTVWKHGLTEMKV